MERNGINADYRQVDVPTGTLAYCEAGAGEALVLLHGGGPGASGMSNFSQNVARLSENFRVIVVDQPGYGRSSSIPFDGSYREIAAEAVVCLLDSLQLGKAHFLGNSLGGGTTLQLAMMHPERAARLVLMGPGGGAFNVLSPTPSEGFRALMEYYEGAGPSLERMGRFLSMMVYDQTLVTEELVADRFERSIAPGAEENFRRTYGSMGGRTGQLWRELHTIPHKTLLTWGRDDRVLPLDSAFLLLKTMPDARLHVFPNCGHWAQLEKRAEFENLVCSFLSGSEA